MRLLLRSALLVLFAIDAAHACRIDRSGPMPVCEAPIISDGERVVVISGVVGRDQHTNIVATPETMPLHSAPFPIHFGSFRVVIENVGEPITLVLSNEEALIFQIEGQVDLVRRIIVMSPRSGLVGVTGVPHSRVEYMLVVGDDDIRHTRYCDPQPEGCLPWQFFEDQPVSKSAYSDEPYELYPFLQTHPYTDLAPAELYVTRDYLRVGTKIQSKDGRLEAVELTRENAIAEFEYEDYKRMSPEERYFLGTKRTLTVLEPADIASPQRLSRAQTLHGWFGLRQLQAEGSLLLPDDEAFEAIYEAFVGSSPEWSEARRPPVFAILIKSGTQLPRGDLHALPDTTHGNFPILVLDDVELTELRWASDICYLFETPRDSFRACDPEQLFPR
ncbi:MAG: hypothetical protein AAFR51_03755 [Pseudomonadota bacterium]